MSVAIPAYNPGGDHYAQNMNAWLHRQQWEDYKRRFQPVEQQLIHETMDSTELLDERLSAISATANQAFDSAMINADIVRGRYGIHQGESQAQANLKRMMRDNSASVADAKNNTRTHTYDRNMNTIAGGSSVANAAIR
ncbi:MAG: hypothetical protein KDA17_03875 [Candidatus Saccharibacteria bacterium]|nr:hypothetical protein [Candidatus Saccharibacteria bacterium]